MEPDSNSASQFQSLLAACTAGPINLADPLCQIQGPFKQIEFQWKLRFNCTISGTSHTRGRPVFAHIDRPQISSHASELGPHAELEPDPNSVCYFSLENIQSRTNRLSEILVIMGKFVLILSEMRFL